ncbi:MAG: hypothetical protein GFH27_549289n234 [Chloroflexi bacterium AL-W]|nr:hypothetical protein [Chloroflexi bacterium AL-N1]NOK66967.1 hypothetical protein [Chloroflexi bacterium AL-N10]NOK74741.1 hypothetical protein [Chloroflexi bacterium AL-N5]NOK81569.1 hypothetical protein [Chloroflexi bacterium AL-W]NOK89039.1 hypothetical protein [Chloroflexi bacterium AL-N15]
MNWIRHTGLRLLLSFGLGLSLWSFVAYIADPDQQETYTVNMLPQGIAPDLVIVDKQGQPMDLPSARITVSAGSLTDITPNNLRAEIDLAGLQPGSHTVEVRPNIENGSSQFLRRINITEVNPDEITVQLERQVTETRPINIETEGIPDEAEQEGSIIIRNSQRETFTDVQVSGPENRVALVNSVGATVDIDGRSNQYTTNVSLQPLSERGEEISGVTIEPEIVNVVIPIRPLIGIKTVPVAPQITGAPASGYIVSEIAPDPPTVVLSGSTDNLDNIQSISTEQINIAGTEGEITRTVRMIEPPGASLPSGQPEEAVVTINVVPIERQFTLNIPVRIEARNIPSNVTLELLSPEVFSIAVSADSESLDNLGTQFDDILGTVSLSDLGPGEYILQPSIDLPDELTFAEDIPEVTVRLRARIIATPVPTAEPEPTSEPPTSELEPTVPPEEPIEPTVPPEEPPPTTP